MSRCKATKIFKNNWFYKYMMCYINVCFAGVYGVFEEKCGLCDHVHLFSTGGLFLSIELSVLIPESSRIYHAVFFLLFLLYFLPWSFWKSKLYFNLISRTSKIFSSWYNVFYDPSSAVSLSRLISISTTLLNLGVNITHSPPFGMKLNMPALAYINYVMWETSRLSSAKLGEDCAVRDVPWQISAIWFKADWKFMFSSLVGWYRRQNKYL